MKVSLRAERRRQRALDLLASRSVPVTDLVHSVPDSDFQDSVHLTYTGAQKVEPAILAVADNFL